MGIPPTPSRNLRTVGWVFAPPALFAALRWSVQWLADRQPTLPAPALVPVSTASGMFDLLWPVALVVAVLLLVGGVVLRLGWRRCGPALAVGWVLLWLAGSAALVQRVLNQDGLVFSTAAATGSAEATVPTVVARVLALQPKPVSLRSLGGTELVLQVADMPVPQRLLLNDPQASALKIGDGLALQLVPGRFSGLFVTDWQAAAPAAPL